MESPDKALKALRVGRVRRIASLGEDDGAVKTLRIPSPFMREALTRARREARGGGVLLSLYRIHIQIPE